MSIFFLDFFLVRALGGFRRVAATIIIQLFVGDLEVGICGMISLGSEFAAESCGTDVWRVLEPRAPTIKCRVGDRQCEFTGLVLGLAHRKSVLAHESTDFAPYKLNDKAVTHRATAILGSAVGITGPRMADL